MLPFEDQVLPTCAEVDLRYWFSLIGQASRAPYIDTLSYINAVFAHRDH